MRRNRLTAPWRGHLRPRVALQQVLALQVLDERAQRRKLASCRRSGNATTMEIRQEVADRRYVHVFGLEFVELLSAGVARESQELCNVIPVRDHRVTRRIAIQSQVIEEVFQ